MLGAKACVLAARTAAELIHNPLFENNSQKEKWQIIYKILNK